MSKRDPDIALQLAHQYASDLLRAIGYTDPVYVAWGDKATAYTDGITIWYPREFLGVKLFDARLTKKLTWIIKGFTLHELGHFLQDLAQVDAMENVTGLNHHFVNVVLDVVGEYKVQKCWPKEWRNLVQLRALTRKVKMPAYRTALMTRGSNFFTYAANAVLCGRFWNKHRPFVALKKASAAQAATPVMRDIGNPVKPLLETPLDGASFASTLTEEERQTVEEYTKLQTYWRMSKKNLIKAIAENGDAALWDNRYVISTKMYALTDVARASLEQGGYMLASYIWSFAQRWPELCDKNAAKGDDPFWGDQPGSYTRNDKRLAEKIAGMADSHIAYTFTNSRRYPAMPESVALYNQLQFNLPLVETSMDIQAPQTLDRRQLVAGAPLPWTMPVSIFERQRGRKAVLCLDISGSMQSDLKDALISAQAVTMALESNSVHVTGVLFETYSYTEKFGTSSNLFPDVPTLERVYELCPSPYPCRGGTSFMFLEKLWRQYPDAMIFVVTDGMGKMPENVSQTDKDRTTVIQLGGSYGGEAISSHVVQIDEPMELAGIVLSRMQ